MGRGGGGRDRSNNEYAPRFEEKERRTGWGVAPPSRHLWVGNLGPHVTQSTLSEHFLRFGEIENITHIPGRNYAFVDYKKEEDAVIALRGLQGFSIAGMPLRIEFAKGVSHDILRPFPNCYALLVSRFCTFESFNAFSTSLKSFYLVTKRKLSLICNAN